MKKIKKKDGSIVYRSSVYLGMDQITGKKVKTTVSGRTKAETRAKERQAILDFQENGATRHQGNTPTVKTYGELVALWLDTYAPTVKSQTLKGTKTILRAHILPRLGNSRLDKLTTASMQHFTNQIAKTGLIHYRTVLSLNRRILQYAVALQLIPFNPARDNIVPKVRRTPKEKAKHFTNDQLRQFLDYLDNLDNSYKANFCRVLYRFLLATGCRIGEAIALEWSDIDLEASTVSISKTYNVHIDGITSTKTESGTRTISIDAQTVRMLKLYKARQWQAMTEISSPNGSIVFASPLTKYHARNNLQRLLDGHLERAGLPRFTFHAFRHTHASLLLNAGISYKELQYRLGHANIAMTLDIYSHLSPDREKTAVSYFEKAVNNL